MSATDGLPSIAEGRRLAFAARQLDPNFRTNPSGGWHGRIVPKPDSQTRSHTLKNSRYGDTIIGTDDKNRLDGNAGDDWLCGRDGNDTLLGGAGADHLHGGDQDDTLIGGLDNDYLIGGTGLDTVSYADVDRGGAVLVNLSDYSWSGVAPNTAVVSSPIPETDTLVSIENAIGTSYRDDFYGSSAANVFDGGAAGDYLFGHGGDDTLIGGDGDDLLV
ncbi:MAG: hypothetical protein WCD75_13030, partial [Rhodoplanes sp.]